ncbi:NUDIX domain-containing protein [Enterococcus sp. BWB1-3]|uniref:NUDIX hydrolase n=1 Tax=Enterococcus sp. BWB1-3 TaxID=2787713 RepID=UPI0019228FB9|nr:NUDIX domain-containing protein [Enterococcus sp. BWB1-3]MBL1228414.1 NUDIX domain-containing protein [Enterococcus sp. BWB1-3]
MDGHITASGIVIKDQKILLIKHPYLNLWLFLGGHIDKDEQHFESAIREVFEETGYRTSLADWHIENSFPIDIDIHTIEKNSKKNEKEHMHYDFRYILKLEKTDRVSAELETKWVEIKDFSDKKLLNKLKEVGFSEWIKNR